MDTLLLVGIAVCAAVLCALAGLALVCALRRRQSPVVGGGDRLACEHAGTQTTLRVVPDTYKPPQPQAYIPERSVKLQPR